MDPGKTMKFLKWIIFLVLAFFLVVLVFTLHPETTYRLENNFHNNMIRSFEDSGMRTRFKDVKFSFWPFSIKLPLMEIYRNTSPRMPNSWLQIFRSIKLTNCNLSMSMGLFRLIAELKCKKIDVRHLSLRWFELASINSALSKDFYFVSSDFRNLEAKQGWWKMKVKADNLIMNGKRIRSFQLNYYFSSRTKFIIEWPELKEKMLFVNEPEQLKVVHVGEGKNFGFLTQSLHNEIKSLWQDTF